MKHTKKKVKKKTMKKTMSTKKGKKLVGKQKKLDMNKNGKLDKQDFKMLRKKK